MIKKFFVYCLYSDSHKRVYIGQTDNIDRRVLQHNSGKVLSTKAYIPYRIIYKEGFDTKQQAVKREKELKLTQGRRYLKSLIN